MQNPEEKWALFWCDLLRPVIFGEIEPEEINQFLKHLARDEVVFPNGKRAKPSVSTLRRKLNRFNNCGFNGLLRKVRKDIGRSRKTPQEIIDAAIDLKKEQPYRSDRVINRFLQEQYGMTIPRATLYRHLKQADATRIKLGVSKMKIRKRIVVEHTHDLWVGDFEEGPYVIEAGEVMPTYLCAFIDHYSRYLVDARYYLRQNLDILIDSWIRALAIHGTPLLLYVDNAKVYHSTGLRTACYRINTNLKHRPPGEPETGGVIEAFFQTVQSQFEREVRAGDILTLQELNRTFSAWLNVAYHHETHTEIQQTPQLRYQQGLTVVRQVDIAEVMASFMRRDRRTVNSTYSDVRLDHRYYRCDPKLRSDRVEVRHDPFGGFDSVEIYSLDGKYLQTAHLHNRESSPPNTPVVKKGKPENNYLDILVRQHDRLLDEQTKGIDYRQVVTRRTWPFHQFGKTLADLMGLKGGLSAFNAEELEKLKKTYNLSTAIDKSMLIQAFENARHKSLPYVCHELKLIIQKKEND